MYHRSGGRIYIYDCIYICNGNIPIKSSKANVKYDGKMSESGTHMARSAKKPLYEIGT